MDGKIVLITGANSGIGKATALSIARWNAHVVLLCRNREKGEKARQEKGVDTSVYLASSRDVDGITGKYFYDRKEKEPIPEADDLEVIQRLWEESEKLTRSFY